MDLLGVFVADLDLERLLERHDQLDGVERIGAQVVHEGGLDGHLLRVDPELFDDDALDLVLDALRHLLSSMRDLPGCPRSRWRRRIARRDTCRRPPDYCSPTVTCKDRH